MIQKALCWILKENSYYAQNGVNGPSVEQGFHCELTLVMIKNILTFQKPLVT